MLKIRNIGDVSVIDLPGRVVLGDGETELYDAVRSQAERGRKRFVLNVRRTRMFDSMGLGTLVACRKHVAGQGGEIRIAEPNAKVRDLLAISRLTLLFDLHDSEDRAVAAFSANRAD